MIAYPYKKVIFGLLVIGLSILVVACGATPEVEIIEFETPVPQEGTGEGTISEPEATEATETTVPAEGDGAEATPEAEATEATETTVPAEGDGAEATPEAEATEATETTVPAEGDGAEATPEAEATEATETTVPAEGDGAEATPEAEATEVSVPAEGDGAEATPEAEATEVSVPAEGESETPVPDGGASYYIEELLINVMESFPVQVSATVRGNLADGCTELESITPMRDGNTFELDVKTSHSGADVCIEIAPAFEETVSLDVEGLPAGEYTVQVAETTSTFTLDVDNTAGENNDSGAVLTLERTACFGTCPIYQIKIYADGRVEYEGEQYVEVEGTKSSHIGPDAVAELLNRFVEAGYLEWNDAYTNYYVTDMPTMITSLTVDGQTKRIERYAGDDTAPVELIELENMIDYMVNSVQWTGQAPLEPESANLANPASEYCVEQGGILEIRRDESGGQFGMCIFPDGSECEEWAFLRGECAPSETSEETEITDVTLEGTQWRFLWGEVDGERFAPFADQPMTLNFDADQVNGNGACNSFFGQYTIEGDSLTIGPVGATKMFCQPAELMELEDQFFQALQSVNGFTNNTDTLTLSLPNGALLFMANMPVEKTIFIGAKQVDCQGVGQQKCYLIKDDLDAEWEYFYDEIVGFEWQPGAEYELRVRITPVENPPADASSVVYELIEIVNEVPVRQ